MQQEKIKKYAKEKFDVTDYEDRQCAVGFVEGYALCMKENCFSDTAALSKVIDAAKETCRLLDQKVDIHAGSQIHESLKKSLLIFEPPYFTFPEKLKTVLDHFIQFCRHLEKETPGKGFDALNEIAPALEIYDAVMACLRHPNAKYEFATLKYCCGPKCRETEFANGLCKSHAKI